MSDAARLAGYVTAHAIWSISDGTALMPILARLTQDDQVQMDRLVRGDAEEGIRIGHAQLHQPPGDQPASVLIFDGLIPLEPELMEHKHSDDETEDLDALIVTWVDHAGGQSVVTAIPYRPAADVVTGRGGPFALHRPQMIELPDGAEELVPEWVESFFAGAAAHPEGSRLWDEYLDDTV